MIINFEIDEDVLVKAVVEAVTDDWKSEICEGVADSYHASDIAEHVSTYDIAHELDMDDLFSNVELDYEELADLIIHAKNFKNDVAELMWQQFSDEFGASMKCVREELRVMSDEIESLNRPFWKRWLNIGNTPEVEAS